MGYQLPQYILRSRIPYPTIVSRSVDIEGPPVTGVDIKVLRSKEMQREIKRGKERLFIVSLCHPSTRGRSRIRSKGIRLIEYPEGFSDAFD